ncbi:MAG: ATP-binding protein [Bacteroidales bacterium]|nr:ATP-binding protein [Bacteroidales bacterium]
MEQITLVNEYAGLKGIKLTTYSTAISMVMPISVGKFSRGWSVLLDGGEKYTLVYHFDARLERRLVERYWADMRSDYEGVTYTFRDIPNMWRNSNSHLRLFRSGMVRGNSLEDFERFIYDGVGAISRSIISLMMKYNSVDDGEIFPYYSDADRTMLLGHLRPGGMRMRPESLEGTLFDGVEEQIYEGEVSSKGGFDDVAGFDDLKKRLMDNVIWPLTHKETARRYRITPPNGMLLYGPPGCGKSYFAQKFAEQAGFSFIFVSPSDVGGMYVHESQGKISELFENAKRQAPCVICFDEIDAMIPKRSTTPGMEYMNTEVNEFLVKLNNCGMQGIFVIGTTNAKELVDPAALRRGRLDFHVEIPSPDKVQRKALWEINLKDRPVAADLDVDRLSVISIGLNAADIAFAVNAAALNAAMNEDVISFEMIEKQIRELAKDALPFNEVVDIPSSRRLKIS